MRVDTPRFGGTLFHQPWMMEAASRGRWHEVDVKRDGRVVARMPFVVRRRSVLRVVDMPPYVRVGGPVLDLPPATPRRQLESAAHLVGELYGQLPQHDRMLLTMAPEHDHTQAFVLAGFTVEAGSTFRMPPDMPEREALEGMKGAIRRDVLKSQGQLDHKLHTDLDEFVTVAHRQSQDAGTRSHHDFALITDMFTAAVKRNQATIISTVDGSGQNMGSVVLLHDDDVVYLWLAARRRVPGNRAYTRMIWEAFRFAQMRGLTLDLDGYASPSAARYLANFGGVAWPRNRVDRTNLRAQCLIVARVATERLLGR